MKIKLLVLCCALILLAGTLYYMQNLSPQTMTENETTKTAGGYAPFPEVAFTSPDGKTFRLGDLKEKTILVHFWAAWCLPCHAEMRDLVKYVESANGKIGLVAIALDSDYADSLKVVDKYGLQNAPHVYWAQDKGKTLSLKTFNTIKVPETIIVNQDRRMVDKIIGPGPWSEASRQP